MSQITPEDIESSFRDVADQIETVAESKKQTAAIGIGIGLGGGDGSGGATGTTSTTSTTSTTGTN